MRTAAEFHHELIDRLIACGALRSAPLIAAFRATPRQRFLDRVYHHRDGCWHRLDPERLSEDDLWLVYSDRALTTRLSQAESPQDAVAISSSSQPSLMAQMLEDLQLRPGLRVLEVGTGTGYNAALLAHVVGPVVSLDIDREVLLGACRHLSTLPDREVALYHADGRQGFRPGAPFDRIQATAATLDLESAWLEQLAPGGLVQAPLDLAPGLAYVVQGEAVEGVFHGSLRRPAYFMPLRQEGEAGRDRNEPISPLPGPDRLQTVLAPWASWSDRRSGEAEEFLPGLAFLAWLEGRALGYACCPDGRPGHGVVDLEAGRACWMGPYEWRVSGRGGHEMGLELWRRWLDLGGPRVEEWQLRAAPDAGGLPGRSLARAAYVRQGPVCAQLWELIEPRALAPVRPGC